MGRTTGRKYQNRIACFDQGQLEAIARALGDTSFGLKGSEIGHYLTVCNIPDIASDSTKWVRIHNAFVEVQNIEQSGNAIIGFISTSMKPARFTGDRERFESIKDSLNIALSFAGFKLKDDGKVAITKMASTLGEAEERAKSLIRKLLQRNVHSDVLKFCQAELLEENYFHAVLEATKSVADKLRKIGGLSSDGAELANQSLSLGKSGRPLVAINSLQNETDKSEQTGFMNLTVGLFGCLRNPTAHAPKIYWPLSEQDALDIFSLVSFVHRKLDSSKKLQNK